MARKSAKQRPSVEKKPIEVRLDVAQIAKDNAPAPNLKLIQDLETAAQSKIVTLYMADGPHLEPPMILPLYEILTLAGNPNKIGLFLRSTGGITEVPWRIVSLLREFCEELQVLVPEIALSGATHIAIGADELVMGPISTLASVDPARRHPLLPKEESGQPIAISVQDLQHCMYFIRDQLSGAEEGEEFARIPEQQSLALIIAEMFKYVHPLALGAIQQSYQLSKLISGNILRMRKMALEDEHIEQVVDKLAEGYYSHGYLISRKEAKDDLRLPVTHPSDELWDRMWALHSYYREEIGKTRPISLKQGPPLRFQNIGFIDSVDGRRVLCQIIDPQEQRIVKGWNAFSREEEE